MKLTKKQLKRLVRKELNELNEDVMTADEEAALRRARSPYAPGGKLHHEKEVDAAGVFDVKQAVYKIIPDLQRRVAELEKALQASGR